MQQLDLFTTSAEDLSQPIQVRIRRFINDVWKTISRLPEEEQTELLIRLRLALVLPQALKESINKPQGEQK
jgi:predicted RecB family endonuclease